MTRVIFSKDKDGIIRKVELKGHAGYAQAGSDIVCAGVSVLAINTFNSIEAFSGDEFSLEENEKKGILSLEFKSRPSKESILLMNSLELGIKDISESYGNGFVKFEIREV